MLTDKFLQVLEHEGVVSITSWNKHEPHVTNTWNSYLTVTKDERLLVPAVGMSHLEEDILENPRVIVTLGSREVEGRDGYQGTGFKLYAEAKLLDEGEDFDKMKEGFPFLRKVLSLSPSSLKQLL